MRAAAGVCQAQLDIAALGVELGPSKPTTTSLGSQTGVDPTPE